MKIAVVHNFYRQPGGEDRCFFAERDLLRSRGHDVIEFTLHNDAISVANPALLAFRTTWNGASYASLRSLFRRERPDVVHFHNTFPLVSPAAYYAARAEGVPVVQSLHNFRMFCAGATLFRDGRCCETCLGRTMKWPAIAHACYRGSRLATASVVAMQAVHHGLGTWRRAVDVFVALTEFGRDKAVEGGLPWHKIVVKPNFCDDPVAAGAGDGGYALFVGRLSPEKGLATLLDGWRLLGGAVPLKIVGDGPLAGEVRRAAAIDPAIEWLGARPGDEVRALMGAAAVLVVPSVWYETFGLVVAEAFSVGTPVLSSRIGALREVVDEGVSGELFAPGDPAALAEGIRRLFSSPNTLRRLRAGARAAYETRMSPDANYRDLMGIYAAARRGPWSAFASRTGVQQL